MQNLKNIKRIGIIGGTFNPIHNAHLISAEYVLDMYKLDKIVFIPTGNPPHKNNVLSGTHRLNMIKLAIKDNEKFLVSSMEVDRNTTTYTIDTLRELKSLCDKDTILYFITGTDTINQVYTWKESDELTKFCKFIVVARPNTVFKSLSNSFIEKYKDSIYFCEIPLMDISSTHLRKRICQEKSISYLTPKVVEDYISQNNLYKKDYFKKNQKYLKKIKIALTEKRYNHSIQVAIEAKNLAIHYGYDDETAFLAGLLHDCCKCLHLEEIHKISKKYGFSLDNVLQKQPDLAHSFLGYYVAKDVYKIDDEDILLSIKYHTTGRENMSNLEKIIYIADYIEPTRKYFDGIEMARYLAYKNLNSAMSYILENTIKFNEQKNRIIHPLSIQAYNYYKI